MFVLIIISIVCISILIPKYGIHDEVKLPVEERTCAIHDTNQILDNPIERFLIFKTIVVNNNNDVIHTNSYTFFGLKYATVELVCNGSSKVLWRRWLV